jgi:hypothetical protein
MEMLNHLLIECPFSRQVWHDILSWMRMACSLRLVVCRVTEYPKAAAQWVSLRDSAHTMDDLETSQ